MGKKLTGEQLIAKIKRLERKVKVKERMFGDVLETVESLRVQVKNQATKIQDDRAEHQEWMDKQLELLDNWRKDGEALTEARITKDRLKDQLGEQTFRQQVSLYLAQVRPHNFAVALREFREQHKGKPQTEIEVLVTVLSMVSNMPYLFRAK